MPETIQDGSFVYIFLDGKRNWIRRVKAGEQFHSNKGIIAYDDIIGRSYGIKVESHSGETFQIHKPSQNDVQISLGRNTQIIYPKDAAIIINGAGICSGSRVVESGTGSGSLTWVLSRAVGPEGHVYSYEIREDMYSGAKKNLEKFAEIDRITLHHKDVLEGIEERDVDAVIFDLATPWLATDIAHAALKPSHFLISYSPTIEQVMKTCKELGESGKWGMIRTVEILERDIMVREGKTRPPTWMIAHTGYITFARSLAVDA
jgi:tRNA (adenine57-N1/adenine58-N1)-methyltransferase